MQEVFRPDSNHFITKKYDIQSFDEELMGHTIYKGTFNIDSSSAPTNQDRQGRSVLLP